MGVLSAKKSRGVLTPTRRGLKKTSLRWFSAVSYDKHISLVKKDTGRSRTWHLVGFATAAGAALVFLVQLIILQGGDNSNALAQSANFNRTREIVSFSPRGTIYDRNGVVLADSVEDFQLVAIPAQLNSLEDRDEYIAKIARITSLDTRDIEGEINKVGREYTLPTILVRSLDQREAIAVEQISTVESSLNVQRVPTRQYADVPGLAHILGYTGSVTAQDLENDVSGQLHPTDSIGKIGVELQYDSFLRGANGVSRFEVDARGAIARSLGSSAQKAGQDVWLTIDSQLQKSLAEALQAQMEEAGSSRASAVATDPNTGEILAMVSLPDYDNNLFAKGISVDDFESLTSDLDEPLVNKVISAGYTSGSVIKPLVAAAALEENVATTETQIVDSGALEVVSENDPSVTFTFRGWREEGLGVMDVRSAIAWSSNIYFYTVAGGFEDFRGLGESRLTQYYRDFGLGQRSGIDLPGEVAGRVPDEQWKQDIIGEPWYVGDTYNISIGQGDLVISPLQMHVANAAIVNNGQIIQPHVFKGFTRGDSKSTEVVSTLDIQKKHLQVVREGMRQVLVSGTTCECTFADVPVTVAGKSGTAETNTPGGRDPHAWFTAFAPYDNPEVMFTVMIEEGVGGSQFAAPVIAEAMEDYFKKN